MKHRPPLPNKPARWMQVTVDSCWIIRGDKIYHVLGNQWTDHPARATVYRDEDDAREFISLMRKRAVAGFVNRDGTPCVVEPVPLEGAMINWTRASTKRAK